MMDCIFISANSWRGAQKNYLKTTKEIRRHIGCKIDGSHSHYKIWLHIENNNKKNHIAKYLDEFCRCGLKWDTWECIEIEWAHCFVDIKCAGSFWLMQMLQVPTLVSQSSYDDSSWRQTVFSQSAALMSLLCPSVHSEGWLSLVCVGDHSTVRPSQAFHHFISCLYMACATMPVSVVSISPLKSVLSDWYSCA